jgi:hypothetical protein
MVDRGLANRDSDAKKRGSRALLSNSLAWTSRNAADCPRPARGRPGSVAIFQLGIVAFRLCSTANLTNAVVVAIFNFCFMSDTALATVL